MNNEEEAQPTRTISAVEALEKGLLPPVRFRWEQHLILASVKGAEDFLRKHTLKIEFDPEKTEEVQDE